MKYLLLIFTMISFQLIMIGQNLEWVNEMGGEEEDIAIAVLADSSGNFYTAGFFSETVDFDSGPDVLEITSGDESNHNGYIQKIDSEGIHIWTHAFIAPSVNEITEIVFDSEGNLILSGFFYGEITFNDSTYYSEGAADVFILKMNVDGDIIWHKVIGGEFKDVALDHVADQDNNIYVIGYFKSLVDFDPNEGIHILESHDDGDASDSYILKLNSYGELVWVRQYSAPYSLEIELEDNHIYVGGRFTGTCDFESGEGDLILTCEEPLNWDLFVLKIELDNTIKWVRQIGGEGTDNITALYVRENNIFIGGDFKGTTDFDPGIGLHELSCTDTKDMYLLNLDTAGNFVYVNHYEFGSFSEDLLDITVDSKKNTYVCGNYKGVIDFDPGPDEFNATNLTGQPWYYVCKLDSLNQFVWFIAAQGQMSSAKAITILEPDHFLLTGTYFTLGDFDPGPDVIELEHHGDLDIFIAKFETCSAILNTYDPIPLCAGDSLIIFDAYQNSEGFYYDTLTSIYGCDSILIQELVAYELPEVNITALEDDTVCLESEIINLLASPADGAFTGAGVSDSEFNPTAAGMGDHIIYYDYEDDNGCSATDSVLVKVVDCLSLPNDSKNKITVFPNPFDDYTTINFGESLTENHTIIIYDILGQVVYRNENIIGSTLEIKKEQLGVGVYILSLFNSDLEQIYNTKLIVE